MNKLSKILVLGSSGLVGKENYIASNFQSRSYLTGFLRTI